MALNNNVNLATEAQNLPSTKVLVMFLPAFYSLTARWNETVVHNQTTCGVVIASTFKDPLTSRRIMTKIVQKMPCAYEIFFHEFAGSHGAKLRNKRLT